MPEISSFDDRVEAARELRAHFEDRMSELTARVVAGELSISDWQIQMRQELRDMNAMMMIAGAGGDKREVASDDWLRLGPELKHQYRFLTQFAHDLESGDPRAIALAEGRARMYARSTQASFWRQAMPVDLPAQPGDGSTECYTNCDCHWEVEYQTDRDGYVTMVEATWVLGATEDHCDTCLGRASEWSPLRIPVSDGGEYDPEYIRRKSLKGGYNPNRNPDGTFGSGSSSKPSSGGGKAGGKGNKGGAYKDWSGADRSETEAYFINHTEKPSLVGEDAMESYVNDYIGTAVWVNAKLRVAADDLPDISPRERRWMEDMDDVVNSNSLPENTTLYRAVNGSFATKIAGMSQGDVFLDRGFASASLGKEFPTEDMGEGDALVKIAAPKGTKGAHAVSVFAKSERRKKSVNGPYAGQQEFVLARNTKFRVSRVEKSTNSFGDPINIVHVEVVE